MIRQPNPIVVTSVSSGWEFFKEASMSLCASSRSPPMHCCLPVSFCK